MRTEQSAWDSFQGPRRPAIREHSDALDRRDGYPSRRARPLATPGPLRPALGPPKGSRPGQVHQKVTKAFSAESISLTPFRKTRRTRNDMPGADVLPKFKTREMDRVLPDMARRWSGGGLVVVWGRPDVDCSNTCYCNTYDISRLALGAPMCRRHRRRNPGAGPAKLPGSALKLLRLHHLWCKFCILRSRLR